MAFELIVLTNLLEPAARLGSQVLRRLWRLWLRFVDEHFDNHPGSSLNSRAGLLKSQLHQFPSPANQRAAEVRIVCMMFDVHAKRLDPCIDLTAAKLDASPVVATQLKPHLNAPFA